MTSSPSRSDGAVSHPKTWSVGTLKYTAGGLAVLFCWLLWGDFAWSMKDRTMGPVLQILLHKFSASDTLTGLLMGSLPSTISMILTPIVSYRSDRLRSNWGRRIPFLLISTPCATLGIVGVAFSPVLGALLNKALGTHSPGLDDVTLTLIGIFWTVFEFSTFVANAVFYALINDVVPQQVLGRFFGLLRAISLIVGIAVSHWVMPRAETYFLWIFLGMGVIYGGGFMLMCFKVKEGEYPRPLADTRQHGVLAFLDAARRYFKECFRHRYYWWYFGTMALAGMSFYPIGAYTIYFAQSLHMDMQFYFDCQAWTFFASLIMAYPLGSLVDRFHPLRACMVVITLSFLDCLWAGIWARDIHTFAIAFVSSTVIGGMWWTVSSSIGLRLLPRANFAQFGSAGGIIGSLGTIALAAVVGPILDYSHHTYRYTFLMSAGLAALGLAGMFIVHAKFMALGGPKNYVAPD